MIYDLERNKKRIKAQMPRSTPLQLYQYFMDEGYIDPCPLNSTFDGLQVDYFGKKLFINPPFSKLDVWCDYVIRQLNHGCTIALLMPARTDTNYFHKLLTYNPNIHFFKGRLKFGGSKGYAPFPTILVFLSKYRFETHYTYGTLESYIYDIL